MGVAQWRQPRQIKTTVRQGLRAIDQRNATASLAFAAGDVTTALASRYDPIVDGILSTLSNMSTFLHADSAKRRAVEQGVDYQASTIAGILVGARCRAPTTNTNHWAHGTSALNRSVQQRLVYMDGYDKALRRPSRL